MCLAYMYSRVRDSEDYSPIHISLISGSNLATNYFRVENQVFIVFSTQHHRQPSLLSPANVVVLYFIHDKLMRQSTV